MIHDACCFEKNARSDADAPAPHAKPKSEKGLPCNATMRGVAPKAPKLMKAF